MKRLSSRRILAASPIFAAGSYAAIMPQPSRRPAASAAPHPPYPTSLAALLKRAAAYKSEIWSRLRVLSDVSEGRNEARKGAYPCPNPKTSLRLNP
jgi:hypothetical protein